MALQERSFYFSTATSWLQSLSWASSDGPSDPGNVSGSISEGHSGGYEQLKSVVWVSVGPHEAGRTLFTLLALPVPQTVTARAPS